MNYEKITKTTARKMYTGGKQIYVLPCNMRTDSMWMLPMEIPTDRDFDKFCNEYQYYNCNSETGKRITFYKEA